MYFDLLLKNGKFYTEEESMPWADCVGIIGETISYVGKEANLKMDGIVDSARIIDLDGQLVIPGIIDGHTHPETIAKSRWRLSLPETEDMVELLTFIKNYCEKHPPEEVPYVYGVSYSTTMFDENGPRKEWLDEYVSDRPVRINDFTDHSCWYNSKALELMGIDSTYRENGVAPFFILDENNSPTGWVKEPIPTGNFEEPMFEKIGWWPPKEVDSEMIKPFLEYLNDFGVMCIMDGITEGEDAIKAFYNLDINGELNMYYEGTCQLLSMDHLDECISTIRKWQKKYKTKHIDVHTVKLFLDGTNEIGNSASLEPHYNDNSKKNYGELNFNEGELIAILIKLNEEELDLHVHVVGDRGFRVACDAYENAKRTVLGQGKSWNIYMQLAHCELIHPDDMLRPAELGIIINWTPHWSGGYFGDAAIEYLGKDRWESMYDFTKIIESGAIVTYSSDVIGPGESIRANPFYSMQIGATRVDIDFPLDPKLYPGSVRQPEKAKLSVKDMLHGYTINGAIPFRFEEKMGSIKAGKLANLVVLDKNIFEIPVEELSSVNATEVYFEGKRIR